MINAYSKLYLNDAMDLLASIFDYAINDCHQDPNEFSNIFAQSWISNQFEKGNPWILSGKTGIEITNEIIENNNIAFNNYKARFSLSKSKEYWAGYYLAYYQWFSCKRFKDLFNRIPLSEILGMYHIYHEMDVSRFVEEINKRYNERKSNLRQIREIRGLSQNQLSVKSGVSLRNIQLYEQRVNNIDKAQGDNLFKLSKALNCNIIDLLENPNL